MILKQSFLHVFLVFTSLIIHIDIYAQNDIDILINKMSIEEKVGQMTQLNLGFLSSSTNQHDGKIKQIDSNKLINPIKNYHVG